MTTVNHGTYYAMKRVSKKHIVAKRQEEHMLFEKKILKAIQSDFIVRSSATACLTSPPALTNRRGSCPLCPLQAPRCVQGHAVHLHGDGVLQRRGALDQTQRSVSEHGRTRGPFDVSSLAPGKSKQEKKKFFIVFLIYNEYNIIN